MGDVIIIISDLTRQYKTMQTQLEGKVEYLEAQVRRLQKALGELIHQKTNLPKQ